MNDPYRVVFPSLAAPSAYFDRKFKGSRQDFFAAQDVSATLYVGNLSFFTSEEQIYQLFSKCGTIKVRDEYRKDYDAGRGGWSPASETEYVTFEMQQEMRLVKQTETYNFAGAGVPTGARDDYYQAEQTQQSFPSYRSKRREREEEENSSKRREREDEDNDGEGYTDEFGRFRRYRNTDE
ncbi:Nuclear cap-binding protein subunit 2 [Entophlyctis luteolus]|nr:Nuclear cap-binding protein subunit 2 [Entophlyctis luteolus]